MASGLSRALRVFRISNCISLGRCSPTRREDAVALFDVIETVDREKIAAALSDSK